MTRPNRAPGEKELFWVSSAKSDLLTFPAHVQNEFGIALSVAQFGEKHAKAKP
jgi:phage-related protein